MTLPEPENMQQISFIGVVEKTRRFFLCSLPPNAINKLQDTSGRYSCKIKDKSFNAVIFQGGRGKFKELPGKTFFILNSKTVHELKLKLGKIRVEIWKQNA